MRELFRGWRRKFGVLTLVVALLFTLGWVRSTTIMDNIEIHIGDSTIFVQSMDQSICWLTGFKDTQLTNRTRFPRWGTHKWRSVYDAFHPTSPPHPDFEWGGCGFYVFRATNHLNQRITARVVPYWFLVLPLTALSTWLLLKRSHQSNQKKITGPIPAGED